MKKSATKKILITLTSLLLCMLFATASAAASLGDIDKDGTVTSADARLALRAAVGLENLTEEEKMLADVDGIPGIASADARLILRVAVGLEQLEHTHSFGKWTVTKAATCTADGVQTRKCACGEAQTKKIPATGEHSFGKWTVTKAATCTADGVQTRKCACGEAQTKKIPATGEHSFGKWTVTKAATCTADGVQTRKCACGEKETKKIPAGHTYTTDKASVSQSRACSRCNTVTEKSFNEYVNSIKAQPHTLSYLSIIENSSKVTKDTISIDRAQLFLLLTAMGGYSPKEANKEIDAMENELKNGMNYSDTENTTFYKNRTLTDNNYPIEGSKIVSELEDSDVASYTVEKVSAVDFREFLADTYTATKTGFEYDTSNYRYLKSDNLIKLTVELKTEKYSEIKDSDIEKTALMKATDIDIRELAAEVLEINSSEGMEDFATATCKEITTHEKIIVYIDTANNAPVASCYISSIECNPELTMDFMGLIDGSIDFTTNTKTVSLYFFDDYFA